MLGMRLKAGIFLIMAGIFLLLATILEKYL